MWENGIASLRQSLQIEQWRGTIQGLGPREIDVISEEEKTVHYHLRTAWLLVASACVSVSACAVGVEPDLGDPIVDGPSGQGGGGKGGATASGGMAGSPSAGKAGSSGGVSNGGVANGGSGGQVGGRGGAGGSGGATSGGGGGKAGAGGGGGSGGKAGAGGGGGRGGSTSGGSANGGTGGGSVGGNLISNSGFETNTSGWSVFGGSATITSTTDEAHSGNRSLLISGRTQTYQGPQYSVLSLITPGDSYSMSVWGRLAGSSTGSLTVTLHYTCSGGSSAGEKYFTWVATSAASASSWAEFSGVKTFPACAGGGSMTEAAFYVESPNATLSYYIDDVVFTPM